MNYVTVCNSYVIQLGFISCTFVLLQKRICN